MKDIEKFISLYESVGIPLKIKTYDGEIEGGEFVLSMKCGDTPKLDGYHEFCTDIVFDNDGKFLSQGFWE